MEEISMVISSVSALFSIFAIVFSVITFRKSVNHDRKLNTLNAYNLLQEQVFDELVKYQPAEIKVILEDKTSDEYKRLGVFCARIEHFCVGLNERIYDMDTFYQLSHGFFDDERGILLPRLFPIIEKRSENSKTDYFSNFHKVLKQMKERKRNS